MYVCCASGLQSGRVRTCVFGAVPYAYTTFHGRSDHFLNRLMHLSCILYCPALFIFSSDPVPPWLGLCQNTLTPEGTPRLH